jgi:alpha-N-arabinofuranosidase
MIKWFTINNYEVKMIMVNQNKIIVNVDANKKKIDPMIYSNFIEHLGECIHNGLWSYDPVNVPLVKNNPRLVGMREDVLKAVKELKPTVLRAFGGCYSDVYHWKDAIGPREKRKKVKNKYWNTTIQKLIRGLGPKIENQFGTDEFLALCEESSAEPYLNVNYGTGTPEEAADWVEYCNGAEDTEYGALRVKYGRKEPYNVKFWGIANEIFGFWEKGHEKHPENYAKKYLEFAKKMREKDPSIKLFAVGCMKPHWNQTLLRLIGEKYVDYLSIHLYLPMFLIRALLGKKHPTTTRAFLGLMSSPPIFEKFIDQAWEDIERALGKDTHVRVAFDEWGVWYRIFDIIKTNFNLLDGLWTALMLIVFQKMSDKCPMANWAQLINCVGTMKSDPDGLVLTPVYLAIKMFIDHTHNNLIDDVEVNCRTFWSKKFGGIPKRNNIPVVSCNATIDDNNDELSLIIVNKHISESLPVNIELKGFNPREQGVIVELTSETPFDFNTKKNRELIQTKEREITTIKSTMDLELNPHSLTILKLSKK